MPSKVRIAYLLSRYPAISHTFFLNEVLGLRQLGIEIETASVNLPDRSIERLSPQERTEAGRTFYLKDGPKLRAALQVAAIALRNPGVLLRGISAVASVRGLTGTTRLYWLAYAAEALLLGHWMRRNDLRHLHVHFGGAVATVGMLTSTIWKLPYSLTIHGPEELQNMASYHLREKLARATFVVCISDFCRGQLMQITQPADWQKFSVVRLGVSHDLLLQPTCHSPSTGDAGMPVHVLCVGRLVPEKGQRLLLHAIARLRKGGLNVRLTLAGDGLEREDLQGETAALHLTETVRFAGATSHAETLAMCAEADIFVLPSFAEGIPVALMEAMALEVTCVSTNIAGIPELIRSGQDGLLVPSSNLDALTEAVKQLVCDPDLRRQLGTSAREQVRQHYNLGTNQRDLARIFESRVALQTGSAA